MQNISCWVQRIISLLFNNALSRLYGVSRMINEYEAVLEVRIGRGDRGSRGIPALVPLFGPEVPRTWHRNQVAVVRSRLLTASVMARPNIINWIHVALCFN
jgi:hypothetical protein